jgi:hypothetical protein
MERAIIITHPRAKPTITKTLVFLLLLISVGCSKSTIGPEKARSDLTNSISFAEETDWFLAFVLNGSSTVRFTRGHAVYLGQEIGKLQQQLLQSRPQAAVANTIRECKMQLEMLRHELVRIANHPEDRNELLGSRTKIQNIREALKRIPAAL